MWKMITGYTRSGYYEFNLLYFDGNRCFHGKAIPHRSHFQPTELHADRTLVSVSIPRYYPINESIDQNLHCIIKLIVYLFSCNIQCTCTCTCECTWDFVINRREIRATDVHRGTCVWNVRSSHTLLLSKRVRLLCVCQDFANSDASSARH